MKYKYTFTDEGSGRYIKLFDETQLIREYGPTGGTGGPTGGTGGPTGGKGPTNLGTSSIIFNNHFGNYTPVKNDLDDLDNKIKSSLNDPSKIDKDDYDRIIRIINIFRKAYDKYATMYIPSGRKDGKVSQSVLREYEYIGGDKDRDYSGKDGVPGRGPWAVRTTYDEWQKLVMNILEDPKLRKVLANTEFVSTAESNTDTQQSVKSSGTNLFSFIEELLNGSGEFKKIRSKMLRKYFNIDDKSEERSDGSGSRSPTRGNSESPSTGSKKKVEWKDINPNEKFEEGKFYQLKYEWDNEKYWAGNSPSSITFYVVKVDRDKVVMVGQRSSKDIKKLLDKTLGSNNYDYTSISGGGNTDLILTGAKDVGGMEIDKLKNKTLHMVKSSTWLVSTGTLQNSDGNRKIKNLGTIKTLVDESTKDQIKINKKFDYFCGAPGILTGMLNNILP
jgi:hypothetical protein